MSAQRRSHLTRARSVGASLVELMTMLSVMAVLLAAAVPGVYQLLLNTRLSDQASLFMRSLSLARSEALRRNLTVSVCATTDQATCSAGANWESGWIVFVDPNRNGVYDPGEPAPLRIYQPLRPDYTLRGSTGVTSSIRFDSSGMPSTAGRFVLCHSNVLGPARAVFVNAVGRINLGPDSNGNGIPEDAAGSDITSCNP